MPRVSVSPWLPAALCAFYRLDPVARFWPSLPATTIHELGHILAVYLCGGKIRRIRLSPGGAVLDTAPLGYRQEALCALAGPAASLTLLLFAPAFPWLAFWGLIQCLYNLLPLYPLDGGRALRSYLYARHSPATGGAVEKLSAALAGLCLIALGIYGTCVLHLGLLPALGAGIALGKTLGLMQEA